MNEKQRTNNGLGLVLVGGMLAFCGINIYEEVKTLQAKRHYQESDRTVQHYFVSSKDSGSLVSGMDTFSDMDGDRSFDVLVRKMSEASGTKTQIFYKKGFGPAQSISDPNTEVSIVEPSFFRPYE